MTGAIGMVQQHSSQLGLRRPGPPSRAIVQHATPALHMRPCVSTFAAPSKGDGQAGPLSTPPGGSRPRINNSRYFTGAAAASTPGSAPAPPPVPPSAGPAVIEKAKNEKAAMDAKFEQIAMPASPRARGLSAASGTPGTSPLPTAAGTVVSVFPSAGPAVIEKAKSEKATMDAKFVQLCAPACLLPVRTLPSRAPQPILPSDVGIAESSFSDTEGDGMAVNIQLSDSVYVSGSAASHVVGGAGSSTMSQVLDSFKALPKPEYTPLREAHTPTLVLLHAAVVQAMEAKVSAWQAVYMPELSKLYAAAEKDAPLLLHDMMEQPELRPLAEFCARRSTDQVLAILAAFTQDLATAAAAAQEAAGYEVDTNPSTRSSSPPAVSGSSARSPSRSPSPASGTPDMYEPLEHIQGRVGAEALAAGIEAFKVLLGDDFVALRDTYTATLSLLTSAVAMSGSFGVAAWRAIYLPPLSDMLAAAKEESTAFQQSLESEPALQPLAKILSGRSKEQTLVALAALSQHIYTKMQSSNGKH